MLMSTRTCMGKGFSGQGLFIAVVMTVAAFNIIKCQDGCGVVIWPVQGVVRYGSLLDTDV